MNKIILSILILCSFSFADNNCSQAYSCKKQLNVKDKNKYDLNCTLPSENAKMRIIAEDVFDSNGNLKTYWDNSQSVCHVLDWMNEGAKKFKEIDGIATSFTTPITLKFGSQPGSRERSATYARYGSSITFDTDSFVVGNDFAYVMKYMAVHEFFHYAHENSVPKIPSGNKWIAEGMAKMFEDIVYDAENPYLVHGNRGLLENDRMENILQGITGHSQSGNSEFYRTFAFWRLMQKKCRPYYPTLINPSGQTGTIDLLPNLNNATQNCKDMPKAENKLAGLFVYYNWIMFHEKNFRLIDSNTKVPSGMFEFKNRPLQEFTNINWGYSPKRNKITTGELNLQWWHSSYNYYNYIPKYSARSFLIKQDALAKRTNVKKDAITLSFKANGTLGLTAVRGNGDISNNFSMLAGESNKLLTNTDRRADLFVTLTNTTGAAITISELKLTRVIEEKDDPDPDQNKTCKEKAQELRDTVSQERGDAYAEANGCGKGGCWVGAGSLGHTVGGFDSCESNDTCVDGHLSDGKTPCMSCIEGLNSFGKPCNSNEICVNGELPDGTACTSCKNGLNSFGKFCKTCKDGVDSYGETCDEDELCVNGKLPDDSECEVCEHGQDSSGNFCDKNATNPCTSFGHPTPYVEGALQVYLAWTCASEIDMHLKVTGPNIIKDLEDRGFEHVYVATEKQIVKRQYYNAYANGEKRAESNMTDYDLFMHPVSIYNMISAPPRRIFQKLEIKRFSDLNMGLLGFVYRNNIDKSCQEKAQELISERGLAVGLAYAKKNGCPFYYGYEPSKEHEPEVGIVRPRLYGGCPVNQKIYPCACVPCEYIVQGTMKMVQYGPIAGAEVEIIQANTYGEVNPTTVYRGYTSNKQDIFKSGIIEFANSDYANFDDETYYVVVAKGGVDLDRDDNFQRDDAPMPNNGAIHAIIKGSDLTSVAFRVNALTEAVYQVSGDLLGLNYDRERLEERLYTISQKLLRKKTFIYNNDLDINYMDILFWSPGVDKEKLYKSYDTYVEPIVVKTYADLPRMKESYQFIYDTIDSATPLLKPYAIEIDRGLPDGSILGKVSILSSGAFGINHIELEGEHNSSIEIDARGIIRLVDGESLYPGATYHLEMIAVGGDGKRSRAIGLVVKVLAVKVIDGSIPRLESVDTYDIPENSVAGTVVGEVHFVNNQGAVTEYVIKGRDANFFNVEENGQIVLSPEAEIDYEKFEQYTIEIGAVNDEGNRSQMYTLSFVVIDEDDTPVYESSSQFNLLENTPQGTIVGHVEKLRDGRNPIDSFSILNSNVPFTIDINGDIRTQGYINYEDHTSYDLVAIANTQSGKSNVIRIRIDIEDIADEIGRPELEALSVTVDENTPANTFVGSVPFTAGSSDVGLMELRGAGHSQFSIDVTGTIRVSVDANIDYEGQRLFHLEAIAHNAHGSSDLVSVTIGVNNRADAVPTLKDEQYFYVEENATANSTIGKIEVLNRGEEDVVTYTLYGEDASNFSVDTNGTIRLSDTAFLDYESVYRYNFYATASSTLGESERAAIYVIVTNIGEYVPVLQSFAGSVDENVTIGTIVGKIEEEIGGDTLVYRYTLDDNSTFSIDENGTLRVNANLDYESQSSYALQVKAYNSTGESDIVHVTIEVNDIEEVVPVLDENTYYIHPDIDAGAYVGDVTVASYGNWKIKHWILSGEGAEHFSVDTNGHIYVAEGVDIDESIQKYYHLQLTAQTEIGDSNSVTVHIVVTEDEAIPTAPTEVEVWSVDATTLLLKWKDNSDEENGYRIYINEELNVTLGANISEYQLNNFTENINYHIVLKAFNDRGESEGVEVESQTALDYYEDFKKLLLDKCSIYSYVSNYDANFNIKFEQAFNRKTGYFNGDIECHNRGLTSAELLNFKALHSVKNLTLSSNVIDNLEGLRNLKSVTTLNLANNNLSNIDGLSALETVTYHLSLENNHLTNTDGLYHLESIKNLSLANNNLSNVDGLSSLEIVTGSLNLNYNDLRNVAGLHNLENIGMNLSLVHNNLTNINGLSQLKTIGGRLYLNDNNLTNVDGLLALKTVYLLNLSSNYLSNVHGLINLRHIGSDLYIHNNPMLEDVSGLKNISSDKYFVTIDKNQYITKADKNSTFCSKTWELQDKDGDIDDDMGQLCEVDTVYSMSDVEKFKKVLGDKCNMSLELFHRKFNILTGYYDESIHCTDVIDEELDTFSVLKGVDGYLSLRYNQFQNVNGLRNLEKVGYGISLDHNYKLTNLNGLTKLTLIATRAINSQYVLSKNIFLDIHSNPLLFDISGISNLERLNQEFIIIDQNQYTIKAEENLSFCQKKWDLKSEYKDIEDYMAEVCIDTVSPVIILKGSEEIKLFSDSTEPYIDMGIDVMSPIDANMTIVVSGEVNASKPGRYILRYTVTDDTGHYSYVMRTIIVRDRLEEFKQIISNKCHSISDNFNEETGVYNGYIDCENVGLTDDDLASFSILTAVTEGIYLSENRLTNLDGLRNLKRFGSSLRVDRNPNLVDISGLNAIEEIDENGIFMGIDTHPYTTKIDGNSILCTTNSDVFVSDAVGNYIDAWQIQMCTDTVAPEITLNGESPYLLRQHSPYVEDGASAYDGHEGNTTVTISGNVDSDTLGEYTIRYISTDSVGNSATITRIVKVESPEVYDPRAFRAVMHKCGIEDTEIDIHFDSVTGVYDQSIWCQHRELSDNDLLGFGILKEVQGDFYLDNNQLNNVDGLNSLISVKGSLSLASNYLENIDGLHSLSRAYYTVDIFDNHTLIDVSGLKNLKREGNYQYVRIDRDQYTVKIEDNETLCEKRFNVVDSSFSRIPNGMLQLCNDTYAPTLILNGDNPTYVGKDNLYREQNVSTNDILDSNISVSIEGAIDTHTLGTQTLTYRATDTSGNSASTIRTVIIEDREIHHFRNTLGKCGISVESVENNFDKDTGIYTGTLACNGKGLNDEDILHLHVLKQIVTGNLLLSENNITNVAGLSSLERIEGYLDLSNNPQLLNLTGLENLIYLKGFLNVTHSPNLTDISALSNVTLEHNYYSVYIDDNQYTVKADGNASFCQSLGRVRNENAENVSKLQVCKDTQAPSITLQGDNPLIIGTGSVYEEAGVTTSDVLDENITVTIEGDVDTSTLGTYTLSYTATDTSANYASTIRTVKVEDVNVYQFRSTLRNKCGINTATFDANFNPPTGFYNENIWCDGKGLTDVDLDTFSVLKETGHDIYINNNTLTHLNGLANLVTIGSGLYAYDNPLEDIIGLSNLERVGTNISLFKTNLTNLDGLEKLVNLGDGLYAYNIKLQNIDALANLASIGTNLSLFDNNLSNVNGLTSLITVGKGIYIYGNQLENINGLSSLESVGTNLVLGGNKLTHLDALSSLTHVGDGIYLWYNQLTNVDGLQGITHVDYSIDINHNVLRNVDGLTNLVSVGDGLYLHHNQLENVDGLSSLESVGGHLLLLDNNLTSVDGLSSLTSVGYTLSLRLNPNLTDIFGLANLQGKEGQKIEIDLDQYMIKVDYNEAFCSKTWNIWDTDLVDIVDDMGLVCE